jgi:S-layer protein
VPLQGEAVTPPTINLTTGVDNVIVQQNGTVINGVANGVGATFNSQDSINGGGHTGLIFNLNDLSVGGTWTPTSLPSVTISAIQTANLNSGEAVIANTAASPQGWTGLVQLNVNESSSGSASTITAAATTNVAVNDGALAGTTDTVQGGANVNVTVIDIAAGSAITVGSVTAPTGNVTISEKTDGNGHTAGPINITGSATTTTVSVTQTLTAATDTLAGITVNDANAGSTTKAGSISTVTIDGLGGAAATAAIINSNALTGVTVNNNQTIGSGVFVVDALTAPTATTLALSLNNDKTVFIDDVNNEYKTINVTTGAKASSAFILDTGATALAVTGSSVLTLSGSALTNLTSIVIGGAAGLVDTDYATSLKLTSVTDTSSGPVTLSLNDQVASFSGASATGAEIITINTDASKAITGNGANGEIVFNAAASTFNAANTRSECDWLRRPRRRNRRFRHVHHECQPIRRLHVD